MDKIKFENYLKEKNEARQALIRRLNGIKVVTDYSKRIKR